MTLRRLTGLLVAFLMLHVSIVGADFRCAHHGDRTAVSHAHAGTHEARTVAATRAGMPGQPCQTPAQADCCRAMTSCVVTAAFAATTRLLELPSAHDAVNPAGVRLPLSPITSPDPPPPKA